MRTRINWEWEKLEEKSEDGVYWFATYRAKVFGGWIVRTFDLTHVTNTTSESMVFVPDHNHQWFIMPPVVDPKVEQSNLAAEFA